jgi:S1-C subfamily serine protease
LTILRSALFLGALLAMSATPARALALELRDLAAQAKPSVVLLTVMDSSGRKIGVGTGFFVSTDGRLVTNYHVIEGGTEVKATLSDGKEVRASGVLASDEAKDIAILQVEGGVMPALPLGDTKSLRAGDEVAVIGSPRGLAGTLSVGIVSAIREDGVGEEAEKELMEQVRAWGIQITAPVSPGSSGSPIMTRDGEVVGVAVGAFNDGQSLNFGIPIEVPKALLAGLGPNARPAPFVKAASKSAMRNLIISAAVFAALSIAYFVWGRRERADRRPPKSGRGARLS